MVNEFTEVLIEFEKNGMKVDRAALEILQANTFKEEQELQGRLEALAASAMGDTPISLGSPEQLSILLYSRRINDKSSWCTLFNIGKDKKQKTFNPAIFKKVCQSQTSPVFKTQWVKCETCDGVGGSDYRRKDGSRGRFVKCPTCGGNSQVLSYCQPYASAGFRFPVLHQYYVKANGFSTEKETLEELIPYAKSDEARAFITGMVRLNQLSHYRSNFNDPILARLTDGDYVHTSYMQAVTATGRISSKSPNLTNVPRPTTFPIKRVFVSRFRDGEIMEADFRQLEFRIAAELGNCAVARRDIADNVDVHRQTADIMTKSGQETNRQDAKPHTFKPLYGGTSGTEAEQAYYRAFLLKYGGIEEWHKRLLTQAVSQKLIVIPSGREYRFPDARRFPSGAVRGGTKIKNYPVQGFATADIVPIACIAALRLFKSNNIKSLLLLEVHDNMVADVYPGERDIVKALLREAMLSVPQELEARYGYKLIVPLDIEIKVGPNWMDMKEIH